MKWKNSIPFNDDDLKIYEAYELACKIEDCYQKHDVSIKIVKKDYNPCYGDGFKFNVNLKGKTRVEKFEN